MHEQHTNQEAMYRYVTMNTLYSDSKHHYN